MPNGLGQRLKRWFLAEQEAPPGRDSPTCVRIANCQERERVEVGGKITHTGVNLQTGWFEALLTDSSGSVRLVWLGRRTISCLHEGTVIIARGRLTRLREELVLYNPEFSVLPS